MRTETWDPAAAIRYDQRLWNELVSLRFLDGPHGALILGPEVIHGFSSIEPCFRSSHRCCD